ncbi:zinc finger protein 616-like isoform X2 [Coccinella septempunctata]|uniref:zinc finger protein 616-like isoform X2 n=1 Tax=Coccinella septempunctata TaxID=41139 RepID=UPI001D07DFB6|nr:zinc finger protein 616-like isoform X2 [Coccinella septempunctata]
MPSTCCVMNCSSRASRDLVNFFRLPAIRRFKHKELLNELAAIRRAKWFDILNLNDRTDAQLKHARICSRHFHQGKPADLKDTSHPDWVPSCNLILPKFIRKKKEIKKKHAPSKLPSSQKKAKQSSKTHYKKKVQPQQKETVVKRRRRRNKKQTKKVNKKYTEEKGAKIDFETKKLDSDTETADEFGEESEDYRTHTNQVIDATKQFLETGGNEISVVYYDNDKVTADEEELDFPKTLDIELLDTESSEEILQMRFNTVYVRETGSNYLANRMVSDDQEPNDTENTGSGSNYFENSVFLDDQESSDTDSSITHDFLNFEDVMSAGLINHNSLCLICNGSCITSRNSIQIFNEETTTCSEKPLIAILSRVLDKDITVQSVHSKLICKKCFKLFDELDELEMRCDEIRGELIRNYKLSSQKNSLENSDLKERSENLSDKGKPPSGNNKNFLSSRTSHKNEGQSKQNLPTIEDIDEELFQIQKEKVDNELDQSDNSESDFMQLRDDVIDEGALEHSSDSEYDPSCIQDTSEDLEERQKSITSQDLKKPNILKKAALDNLKPVKEEFEVIVSRDGDDYTCSVCENEPYVGDRKTIITHMKTIHNLRLYICDVCGLDFRKRNELSAHLDEHVEMEEGDFQCEICNRIFSNLRLFRIHKRMHAPQHKAWECEECGKKYSSKNLLDEHRNIHSGVRPYVCDKCGKDFASKYTFKAHEKTHEIRPRPYLCGQCPKTFLSQQNLTQHERTHLGIKEYSCHLCGKQFGSAHNLEVHSIVHTGYKPFACGLCGKAFARKAEIRDHERTHTGERPFQCEFCGARFSQRSNLQSHKRATHYDDKRHKCEQCGKAFKRRRLLDYHLKAAHTGERPFKCNICDATFVYPEHFKKHRRIHTGEKPFLCEVCGKAFNSRDNRNAHRFIHSDKKPYECLVCGTGFMRKPLLYQHMQAQGHLNDTIVVNQPRLTTDDDQLVTVNEEGEMEIVDPSVNPEDSKLYIAEHILAEEELVEREEDGHIEHIIIDGQHITFKEGEAEYATGDLEEIIQGSILSEGETQIVQTEEGPMQLVKVRIPDENGGEQEAWVKLMSE